MGVTEPRKPLDKKVATQLGQKLEAAYSAVAEDGLPEDLLALAREIESKL